MNNKDSIKPVPPLKMLAIDTATSSMTVAVTEDGRVLEEINSYAERNHSIHLIPHIKQALAGLGLQPADLNGIAVGRGPGSYTGVRIGITVAKTIAWALDLPLVGVSSLEAMAAGGGSLLAGQRAAEDVPAAEPATVWVVPMLNARRGQVYTALYAFSQTEAGTASAAEGAVNGNQQPFSPALDPSWQCLYEDSIRLMDHWVDELLELARTTDTPPSILVFTGETEDFASPVERLRERAAAETPDERIYVHMLPYAVQARHVALLGGKRLSSGEKDDPHLLLPNYAQLPEAEVKLLAKSN